MELLDHKIYIFNFIRYCLIVLQSSCTNSCQLYESLVSHFAQYLMLLDFSFIPSYVGTQLIFPSLPTLKYNLQAIKLTYMYNMIEFVLII